MYSRILVPVELTEKDRRAVAAARDLASGPEAEVTLLHVIETLDLPFEEMEDFYARLEERAKRVLDDLAEELSASGVDVVQRIVFGARVPEIVACGRESRAELVVLAARKVDPESASGAWSGIAYQTAVLCPMSVLLLK
jgi:nucleotide-binding universal stress UspA family protein